jgi:hypothetical protein
MNSKIEHLAERRLALLDKVANQRLALAQAITPFRAPLAMADKGINALRYLAQHPVLVAGILTIALMIKPKGFIFMLQKGWLVWRVALAARHRLKE